MKLGEISKVGIKTIELLNKLNIYETEDLISYYPYRYNIYRPINLGEWENNDTVTINATIETIPKLFFIRRNLNRLSFKALTNNLLINVTIFNRPYLKTNLDIGSKITLIGKYDQKKNAFVANNIKFGFLTETQIEPVYHTIKGLKNTNLNNYIRSALIKCNDIIDYIPDYINKEYNFLNKKDALRIIHNPTNPEELKQAKLKLVYEELFIFMLKVNFLKMKNNKILGLKREFDRNKVDEFIKNLPFELTPDQISAVNDCLNDLSSSKRMNRLIQGDVGSGKTIVATIACFANALSGYQSALMVPTEILATQHYENIKSLMERENINVGLLVGSQKKSEKTKIIKALKNGEIDIIIGTHALISDDVEFKNLGLVITDEQHRFGVNQRSNLQNKGTYPDIIYMSATPIPRTYALTIYKDMDTSIIKTKPSGRKEIKTFVKKTSELKEVLMSILEEIKKGHQVYVVAPSIMESEERDTYDVENLKKDFLKAYNNKIPIATLHGKVKQVEKEKIMNDFKNGVTKILIATTVIEVGVDVKNATTIVIFNAEYYGLATLHQLRGRVGRNDLDSYCYLICDKEIDRLKVLEQSNDGFYISEQDFLMRKGGDIFGTKQSGDMVFKIADLRNDFKILLKAREDSEKFIESGEYKTLKYLEILKDIASLD
jgi:ATP-dependent DNA helicase RecG